jgi:hypothetical protein
VPATIITSDWRGEARRKAEALDVVARHRYLHHLDRATGEPELHPHERAGSCPGNEIVRRGDEKSLVGKVAVEVGKKRTVRADWLSGARSDQLLVRCRDRLHSSLSSTINKTRSRAPQGPASSSRNLDGA